MPSTWKIKWRVPAILGGSTRGSKRKPLWKRGGKVGPDDEDGGEDSPTAAERAKRSEMNAMLIADYSKADLDGNQTVLMGYGARWMLHPNTKFRRRWDIVQMVVLIYISIMVPIRVGYSESAEGAMYIFEFLIDLYFDVDVVLNFITGYETDDGTVLDLRLVRKKYLSSWFMVDFLACIPIDLVLKGLDDQILCSFRGDCAKEASGESASMFKMLKVLRLARLMKLLRLMRISRLLNRYENQLFYVMPLINIFRLVFVLMFLGHLFGCFFYYFSTSDWRDENESMQIHRESWLFQEFCGEKRDITADELERCLGYEVVAEYWHGDFAPPPPPPIPPNPAAPPLPPGQDQRDPVPEDPALPMDEEGLNISGVFQRIEYTGDNGESFVRWRTPFSFAERYIASMYWAFTTMTTVGYGDISATNKSERMFAILGMIVGGFVFSGIIGNISKMIERMDTKKKAYNDKMDEVAVFLKDMPQVSKDLRNRILAFYRKQVGIHRVYDTKQLLSEMPFELRSGILLHMYKGVTEKVEFLKGTDEIFITDVCSRLVPHSTPPQTFVYQRGEEGGGMFIVLKGELWILDLDKKTLLLTLIRNDYVGESTLLQYLDQPAEELPKRTENVLSVSTSDLLSLSLNDLVELCKTYPIMLHTLNVAWEKRKEMYKSHLANAAEGAISLLRSVNRSARDVARAYHVHLRKKVNLRHPSRNRSYNGSLGIGTESQVSSTAGQRPPAIDVGEGAGEVGGSGGGGGGRSPVSPRNHHTEDSARAADSPPLGGGEGEGSGTPGSAAGGASDEGSKSAGSAGGGRVLEANHAPASRTKSAPVSPADAAAAAAAGSPHRPKRPVASKSVGPSGPRGEKNAVAAPSPQTPSISVDDVPKAMRGLVIQIDGLNKMAEKLLEKTAALETELVELGRGGAGVPREQVGEHEDDLVERIVAELTGGGGGGAPLHSV